MSKKSRRRNKKILAALALAGGAAMLGRRGKGAVTGVVNPNEATTAGNWITQKVVPDVVEPEVKRGVKFDNPTRGRLTVDGRGPNEIAMERALTAGNRVPPSMRGGALHAEGYQRRIPGQRHYPGGWEGGYSMRAKGGRIGAKKGGRVTGIAKRGFGRALMKGKR